MLQAPNPSDLSWLEEDGLEEYGLEEYGLEEKEHLCSEVLVKLLHIAGHEG